MAAAAMSAVRAPDRKSNLARWTLQMAGAGLWDNLANPPARKPGDVPWRIEAVTDAWLTAALCRDGTGVRVNGRTFGPRTSGSTVRRRISISYSGEVGNADLPAATFSTSWPRLLDHR